MTQASAQTVTAGTVDKLLTMSCGSGLATRTATTARFMHGFPGEIICRPGFNFFFQVQWLACGGPAEQEGSVEASVGDIITVAVDVVSRLPMELPAATAVLTLCVLQVPLHTLSSEH